MTKRKPKELLKTRRYEISSDELEKIWNQYNNEKLSMRQLSIRTGIGYWSLRKRFNDAGYKFRNRTTAYELARQQGRIGGSNRGLFRENSTNWKGGRIVDKYGYAHLKMSEHPRATTNGYVREHLVVWETHTGKSVPNGWHIHHINGNKSDNRIENLLALPSREHGLIIPYLSKKIKELELEIEKLKRELNGKDSMA